MSDDNRRRIPIVDRRVAHQPEGSGSGPGSGPGSDAAASPPGPDASAFGLGADGPADDASDPTPPSADVQTPPSAEGEAPRDFLDDLKRLQADFDNYRKRMMREQAATSTRAKARLMERLLPVLDDFERALAHEDSGATELIYKQLRSTLEAEGLEEIEAEGKPFDPNVHEAIDSREDGGVEEIVVQSVYRRGYKVGDHVLRAAMVVVARPPEPERRSDQDDEEQDAPEAAEG